MSPQERKQVTILSSAIGVVLLGGVFWVRSILTDPSQKPSPVAATPPPVAATTVVADNRPATPPATTTTTTNPVATKDAVADTSATDEAAVKTTPSTTGDPFRKVLPGDKPASTDSVSLADAQAKASANANRKAAQKMEYPAMQGQMPLPDATSSVKPFQPSEALNSSLKLEGIVSNGKGPMAVVTFGGTTLYLKQGETFGDGIHVDAIHRLFATFSHNKKVYRVDVGGGLQ